MPIYRLEPIDDFLREQSWKHTLLNIPWRHLRPGADTPEMWIMIRCATYREVAMRDG